MGVSGQRHNPAALPPLTEPIHLVQDGWTPGTVWKAAKNLAPPPHRDSILEGHTERMVEIWHDVGLQNGSRKNWKKNTTWMMAM